MLIDMIDRSIKDIKVYQLPHEVKQIEDHDNHYWKKIDYRKTDHNNYVVHINKVLN